MKTCWVIYTYKDRLSGTMAKKFTGDTYEEIENEAKAWHVRQDNIEIVDVAETVMRRKIMNNAILLQCDDFEGLYINNKLVKEGHTLNEGSNRLKFFVKLSQEYDFDLNNLKTLYLTDDDEKWVMDVGSFPEDISDFKDDYKEMDEED